MSGLQETIRNRIAKEMDGGKNYFCTNSIPNKVCRVAHENTASWNVMAILPKSLTSATASHKTFTSLIIV